MRMLILACGVLALCGCFSTFPSLYTPLNMTYTSDPAGAMVYEEGKLLGYAPIQVEYSWELAAKNPERCMNLRPVTVRWASGAEAKIESLSACTAESYRQQFAFVRPEKYPGRVLDVQFAAQQREFALMQQQLANQERAALYNYLLNQNAQSSSPTTLNCSSRRVGNTVYTDCL